MENTALVTLGHLKLVEETTSHRPQSIIFAGGASKSPLWCQILADVLGVPVSVTVVKEATALGAAILAGKGVGIYKSVEEATTQLVKIAHRYEPDFHNHLLYEKMYTNWQTIYKAQLVLSQKEVTRYMWYASGLKR